ncbi:MAG: type I-C CRISPR-associated protein Cas8c/Csd1, partial [Deferribacteraceae bacterium]|nr:type I-C CRISPR-associated protein Cas8c/Csd1 [Deferribacteraceae bacterium]
MLNQLVEYGKRVRKIESDALKNEPYEITLTISKNGDFISWNPHEKKTALVELITAKKGKARLLLDKAEEVLGIDEKKHELFLDKLAQYWHLPSLKPIRLFYENGKVKDALADFDKQVPPKQQNSNIAFRVYGEEGLLHEHPDVISEIEKKYAEKQKKQMYSKQQSRCSVC